MQEAIKRNNIDGAGVNNVSNPDNNVQPVSNAVCSYNEWDLLEEVIVGRADLACVPEWHPTLEATMPERQKSFFKKNGGTKFCEKLIEAAAKELDNFALVLQQEGVTVVRPDIVDWEKDFSTPDFKQPCGLYGAMPRDYLLVIGDEIIESPMAWRSRYFEFRAYRELLKNYFKSGARWTMAPKPLLSDKLYNENFELHRGESVITEFEPVFDAADFMRCGKDIFCQKSHVTNKFGIEWLRRHLGDAYRIHVLDFNDPKAMHIDASFIPLAPGRLLLNQDRRSSLPPMFDNWEILTPPRPEVPDDHPLYFTSKWLSVNVLSIDEERVVVEANEKSTIRFFKNQGFKPIEIPFRNFMSLGGAFHCATTDIRRKGILESYFNI